MKQFLSVISKHITTFIFWFKYIHGVLHQRFLMKTTSTVIMVFICRCEIQVSIPFKDVLNTGLEDYLWRRIDNRLQLGLISDKSRRSLTLQSFWSRHSSRIDYDLFFIVSTSSKRLHSVCSKIEFETNWRPLENSISYKN